MSPIPQPHHHPTEAMLLDYAAGSQSEAAAMLVATHLTLCPDCRRAVRALDAVGGALLEAAPVASATGTPPILERMLARLDEPAPAEEQPAASAPASQPGATLLPAPLRAYLPDGLDAIRWRSVTAGLDVHDLPVRRPGVTARLMRIRRGQAMPRHTHGGTEQVLVLAGGFHDERGHYVRGDVALADRTCVHRPVADDDGDCLCLAVVEGRLKLTGPVGRLLNLFLRY